MTNSKLICVSFELLVPLFTCENKHSATHLIISVCKQFQLTITGVSHSFTHPFIHSFIQTFLLSFFHALIHDDDDDDCGNDDHDDDNDIKRQTAFLKERAVVYFWRWTFNGSPTERNKYSHHFDLTQAWSKDHTKLLSSSSSSWSSSSSSSYAVTITIVECW